MTSPKHAAPRGSAPAPSAPGVEPGSDVVIRWAAGELELAAMVRECEVDCRTERWLLAKALLALAVVAAFVLMRLAYVG